MRLRNKVALLFVLLGIVVPLHAHKPSDSYLSVTLDRNGMNGRWDVALRDLDFALALDGNEDGAVTWGELKQARHVLDEFARRHLRFRTDERPVSITITNLLVTRHSDGMYAVLQLTSSLAIDWQHLTISYDAFFDLDPQHRGLLRLESGGAIQTAIFAPNQTTQKFDIRVAGRLAQAAAFVRHGIWHIWTGYDHILFLLALLLPAGLRHTNLRPQPTPKWHAILGRVLKIVTAFTLAHSVTLALAACGVIHIPSRWIESVIALSVVFAALGNLFPRFRFEGWKVAFSFGLIHGFGFAEVLRDLGLTRGTLALDLISFNLGVECGQLAIVALVIPLLCQMRHSERTYQGTLRIGSLLIAVVAALWTVERAFDWRVLQF